MLLYTTRLGTKIAIKGDVIMIIKKKLTHRDGKSLEMKQRKMRLTEEENAKLDEILDKTGLNLRDLMAEMIEDKWMEEINNA
ncbi:TPA: hypothetical protein I9007_000878 [Clostridium perfringens]|nr:hypothetical protein [Clostridium perfringens]HAT4187965.1 hypothetical protein [Clostridium perfringens]HAT4194257.1 hypothetical protein [Clostridium perfringens]HAT4196650.1 hypothetical protein [Clostridium perfringens]HAT4200837.1 hypothetical protein [Clostridium perfringens]